MVVRERSVGLVWFVVAGNPYRLEDLGMVMVIVEEMANGRDAQ